MSYTLDNITIEAKRTPSGIGYLERGTGSHIIVYLHGIGERGDGSEAHLMKLLGQGPFACDGWKTYTWRTPEIFNYPIRIVYPQLPTSMGSWTVEYINRFLDEIYNGEVLCLAGWSLGGGGVCRYINQPTPKYDVQLSIAIASAISGTGTNVKNKYWFSHATNDSTVKLTDSNGNPINTDQFVSGIPNFDSSRYKRGTSGDHWYNPFFKANAEVNIYEELLAIPSEPVQDIPVDSFFLRGDKLIAKVGQKEIILQT